MLRGFPNIRPYIDCDDVLQNSILRFMRTLQTIQPATTRDFFNLAAVHMRRELIDLARRASRTIVTLSLNRSVSGDSSQNMPDNIPDTLQPEPGAEDFALWVRFHEAVENLPLEEREVIGLIFYHGWKQRQIAELFQVNERTIRRRWVSACKHLRTVLRKEFDS
jgi:RNA polymerase sigma-70 factor (ECF subfamily)